MGLFIELRCELRSEGVSDKCWSEYDCATFVCSGDTKKEANLALTDLFEDAKSAGWHRWKSGWVCPECVKAAINKGAAIAAQEQK